MGRMTIEQAEKLLDDLATLEEFICKRADEASGYTRSGNESIRTSNAKTHEQHAKEYRQILRYLTEYRLMQAEYAERLKADITAMLDEIRLQAEENIENIYEKDEDDLLQLAQHNAFADCFEQYNDLIQEKINALKGEKS